MIALTSISLGIMLTASTGLKEDLRRIYLNGVDISSATHQQLENVHLRIDGQGNIFIEAPHYEVNEENTYLPLSNYNAEGSDHPPHSNLQAFPASRRQIGSTEALQPLSKQAIPSGNLNNVRTQPTNQMTETNEPASQNNP